MPMGRAVVARPFPMPADRASLRGTGGRRQRAEAAVRDRGCTEWLIGAIMLTLCVGMIVVWWLS